MRENSPFFDSTRTDDERIDWLLSQMTLAEKFRGLSGAPYDLERLGIRVAGLGGEAAHGVEARNDQFGSGIPDKTTSFPQPIGMSASWDPGLMEEAGRITGEEARILAKKPDHLFHGLSRWAPTVDLERDPRWGRNEEGYGEDATLTGAMAGSYVRGMRGGDPRYILCGATLKHFYGNNTENGRGWKNATIDVRNREELYLQPFLRVIAAGATGVMTAYNRINGATGILNDEVLHILKEKHGLMHAVCDGGALTMVSSLQHEVGLPAEAITGAIRSGVDSMSEHPDSIVKAAEEAYELGILSEKEIDGALRNTWRLRLRLGLYDGKEDPFGMSREIGVAETDMDAAETGRSGMAGETCTAEASETCLKLSDESLVLLKNSEGLLPLDPEDTADLAVIGPMGNVWYQDWYGGEPPRRSTLADGIRAVTGKEPVFDDAYDTVTFTVDGKGVGVAEDGMLVLWDKDPEPFYWMDWGEGNLTLKHVRTGKFVRSRFYGAEPAGALSADKDAPFDWFVMEIFHPEEAGDGTIRLCDRFRRPVVIRKTDGRTILSADAANTRTAQGQGDTSADDALSNTDPDAPSEAAVLRRTLVSDGKARAAALASKAKNVVLALGCCSMICAKEEIDRKTLLLAKDQRDLAEAVCRGNPRVILMLFTNYPYTFAGVEKKVSAILMSATGSQDMGLAAARALFGETAPAGRLVQTWYASDDQLPDINDYDIIRGGRTYRYFDGEPLWPFGYGLTYTDFVYSGLTAQQTDADTVEVHFTVTNVGDRKSDEVAQVYGIAPPSRVKKPLRQLLAFTRLKEVAPGEAREVTLRFSAKELAFYDTISGRMMIEEGSYEIFAGRHCLDGTLKTTLKLAGEQTGVRDASRPVRADHYDDCSGTELVRGAHGLTAVTPRAGAGKTEIVFRDCLIPADAERLLLLLWSEKTCTVEISVNGKSCGSFTGDTGSFVPGARFRENSLKEGDPRPERWPAVNCEIPVELTDLPALTGRDTISFKLTGEVRFMRWKVE